MLSPWRRLGRCFPMARLRIPYVVGSPAVRAARAAARQGCCRVRVCQACSRAVLHVGEVAVRCRGPGSHNSHPPLRCRSGPSSSETSETGGAHPTTKIDHTRDGIDMDRDRGPCWADQELNIPTLGADSAWAWLGGAAPGSLAKLGHQATGLPDWRELERGPWAPLRVNATLASKPASSHARPASAGENPFPYPDLPRLPRWAGGCLSRTGNFAMCGSAFASLIGPQARPRAGSSARAARCQDGLEAATRSAHRLHDS
jgi:hypothetical protein